MLELRPITMREAKEAVARWHRHNRPPTGGLFAVAATDGAKVVGVVIAGRPVARALQDGLTVELTRLATGGHRNACSFLYGAARRAAAALGYRRVYTYTLAPEFHEMTPEEADFVSEGCPNFKEKLTGESGASVRAAGFVADAVLKPRPTWSHPSRPRVQTDLFGTEQRPTEAKVRWVWPAPERGRECRGCGKPESRGNGMGVPTTDVAVATGLCVECLKSA